MPNIGDLIRDKLSSDGQVLNLKAQFLREVGAKELANREELKNVRSMDLSQNGIGDEGVRGSTCIRHVVDDFHEKLHVPVHEHAMTTSQT